MCGNLKKFGQKMAKELGVPVFLYGYASEKDYRKTMPQVSKKKKLKQSQIENRMLFLQLFMPCPFTGRKMFFASPNFLRQTKNLFTNCGGHKHFMPDKKIICTQ